MKTQNTTAKGGGQPQSTVYDKIGFGQCGLIFAKRGFGYVVKVARPAFHGGLWEDFLVHLRLFKALRDYSQLRRDNTHAVCLIPRVFAYVDHGNTWWDQNQPLLPMSDEFPVPSMALLTQRIPPLPETFQGTLVDKYCPIELQGEVKYSSTNSDCLARVYLGRRRTAGAPLSRNFTLRNFNLCLDQMVELGLPVFDYARAMAECLAIAHWEALIDGYDIEFVLSDHTESQAYAPHLTESQGLGVEQIEALPQHTNLGDPFHPGNSIAFELENCRTRIWVLDFNLCSRFCRETIRNREEELVQHLVLAFFENDPYYPLPLMEADFDKRLWSTFEEEYQSVSEHLLQKSDHMAALHLPRKFLDACVERERQKLEQGHGHGHRDLKG